jgi:hypothetical protein
MSPIPGPLTKPMTTHHLSLGESTPQYLDYYLPNTVNLHSLGSFRGSRSFAGMLTRATKLSIGRRAGFGTQQKVLTGRFRVGKKTAERTYRGSEGDVRFPHTR